MKRLLAALFLALVGTLVVASGVASADPKQDLVSGTGHFIVETIDFDGQLHVNAQSGPSGEAPRGHFFLTVSSGTTETFDIKGRVTCVNVNGNLAAVAGVVTKSRNPSVPEGTGILINILDGGPGEQDVAQVDSAERPPTTCPFVGVISPTTNGNFVVHDAMP